MTAVEVKPVMLRVSARTGLPVAGFRTLNLVLKVGRWSMINVADPKVRADVVAYYPSHVAIAPGQDAVLEQAGLVLVTAELKSRFAVDSVECAVLKPLPVDRLIEVSVLDTKVKEERAKRPAPMPAAAKAAKAAKTDTDSTPPGDSPPKS